MNQGIWYPPPQPQQQYRKFPILPVVAPDVPPNLSVASAYTSVIVGAWVPVQPHGSNLKRPPTVWAVDTTPPGVMALVPVWLPEFRLPQRSSPIAAVLPVPIVPDNPPIRRFVPNVRDIWQQLVPPRPQLKRAGSSIIPPEPAPPPVITYPEENNRRKKVFRIH